MKQINKQILEAINRGINIALDDFEDQEIQSQKVSKITGKNLTHKTLLELENFVDLGLPSGTLWNKYNLGVNPNMLDEARYWFGEYYQWSEINSVFNPLIDGFIHNKNIDKTRFSDFKLCDRKYNDEDKLRELMPEDDPVFIKYKSSNYHMPTYDQFLELKKYTSKKWENNYQGILDLKGLVLTGKNGNEIFFPANGFINNGRWGAMFEFTGESPYIWTKNLYINELNTSAHYGPYCFSYHNSGSQYDYISLDWMVREHAAGIRAVYTGLK